MIINKHQVYVNLQGLSEGGEISYSISGSTIGGKTKWYIDVARMSKRYLSLSGVLTLVNHVFGWYTNISHVFASNPYKYCEAT